jgi:hypothetical protein
MHLQWPAGGDEDEVPVKVKRARVYSSAYHKKKLEAQGQGKDDESDPGLAEVTDPCLQFGLSQRQQVDSAAG